MHKKIIFMIVSLLILSSILWMTLSYIYRSDIPLGAPVDYFEVIDNIEQSNVEIFVYANEFQYKDETSGLDFYGDTVFFNVSSLYDLPKSEGMIRILVVDLFKVEEECSYDDWEYLLDLHEKNHYAIIFIGDNSADKEFLYNYIVPSSNTSMIVFYYDEDNVSSVIHVGGETASKAIETYQILRQVEDIVEYETQRE